MRSSVRMLVWVYVLLLLPLNSFAYYVVHLKNGRQIVTSQYQHQGNKIFIQTEHGFVELREDAVRSIDKKDESQMLQHDKEEKIGTASLAKEDQKPNTAKAMSTEEYKKKKEDIKLEIETVLEQYRESISQRDKDKQELLRQELTGLSKQIYDINDMVKARHNGRLPEGWTQE